MIILYKIIIFSLSPWLFRLWFFYNKDNFQPEPKKIVAKVFLFGILIFAPAWFLQFGLKNLIEPYLTITTLSFVMSVIFAPISEEIIKFFGFKRALFHYGKNVDEPVDAMIYSIAIWLGFASIENLFYIAMAYKSGIFVELSLLRAMITIPAHAIFASMRWYAVGMSKFNKSLKSPKFLIFLWIVISIFLHILLNFSSNLGNYWEIISLVCMIFASLLFWRFFRLSLRKIQKLQTNNMYLDWYFDIWNLEIIKSKKTIILPDRKDKIEKIRQENLEKNKKISKRLYNGQIYFLEKYIPKWNKLNLHIWITDYKMIYGRKKILEWDSFTHIEPIRNLYTEAIIKTADWYFLLWIPSGNTVSSVGKKFQTIWWICSPDEKKLEIWENFQEMLLEEMKEEVGLKKIHTKSIKLIWWTQSYIWWGVGLVFYIELNIDSTQTKQIFLKKTTDKEMSDIAFFGRQDMMDIFRSMTHTHYVKLFELLEKRERFILD